jgi:hypothetical protein
MLTPFATSPHSGPHTPPRSRAPSVKHAKSSPVSKVPKCFLPGNREQYQEFRFDDRFLLGSFEDQAKLLQFLNVTLPLSPPDVGSIRKETFLVSANKLARYIRNQCEDYLFLYLVFSPKYGFHFRFPRVRYPSVPGHRKQITTWTR